MAGKKLGYTWYPNDWRSSDRVLKLSLSERGLYREIIDMAYMESNKIVFEPTIWARRLGCTVKEINRIIDRLNSIQNKDSQPLITIEDNIIGVPSCEPRLSISDRNKANGQKGGRPKNDNPDGNPTKNPDDNPPQNPIRTQQERQRERERENKREREWNQKPKPEDVGQLPDHFVKDAQQRIYLANQFTLSPDVIRQFFETWKQANLSGLKFYNSENDVFSHFVNVAKKEKFSKPREAESPNEPLLSNSERLKRYQS